MSKCSSIEEMCEFFFIDCTQNYYTESYHNNTKNYTEYIIDIDNTTENEMDLQDHQPKGWPEVNSANLPLEMQFNDGHRLSIIVYG